MKSLLKILSIVLALTMINATITEASVYAKGRGRNRASVGKGKYKKSGARKRVNVSRCPGLAVAKSPLE